MCEWYMASPAVEGMATTTDATTAWDDQRVWEDAGFLCFLEEHKVSTKDLLTPSCNGDSLRFFR